MLFNEMVGQRYIISYLPETSLTSLSMNDHSVFSIVALAQTDASTSNMNNIFTDLQIAQEELYANDTGPCTAPSGITNGFQLLSDETLQVIGAQAIIDAGLVNHHISNSCTNLSSIREDLHLTIFHAITSPTSRSQLRAW